MKASKQLLNHPFVLYFVLVVALANLLYLSVAGKAAFAGVFLLVGFLTSFFSKNMTVILVISMVATNVLQFGSSASISEGLENEEKEEKEEPFEGKEDAEDEKVEENKDKDKEKDADKDKKTETVEKVAKQQQDLVDKVKKMEPMLKQVESFMDRLDKFSSYK